MTFYELTHSKKMVRVLKNQITIILFKIWPTDRFSKAKSYNFHFHKNDVTWTLSANGLLPAPKAEVITGPTVLRCFIKYVWKINIWNANLVAILLETTDLIVDNSPPQKVFFKGV